MSRAFPRFSMPSAELFATCQPESLGRSAVRGSLVTMGCQVLNGILGMISLVVLTRLYLPTDFGVIALAATVQGVVQPLADFGLSSATINRATITRGESSNLFWLNLAFAGLVAAIVVAAAVPLSRIYHEPRVAPASLIIALVPLVSAAGLQHDALLRRALAFHLTAPITVISPFATLFTGVVLKGYVPGYIAIGLSQVAGALAMTGLRWTAGPWVPSWYDRKIATKALVKFGAQLAGGNVVSSVASVIDNSLIGFFYTTVQVGLYSRAYNLMNNPISKFFPPLFGVLYPVLCRVEEEAKFRRIAESIIRVITFVFVPIVAVVILNAHLIVHTLFGPKWMPIVPMVQWLSLSAFTMPLSTLCYTVLNSRGRVEITMRLSIAWALVVSAFFFATVPFGIVAMCMGFSAANFLMLIASWWFASAKGAFAFSGFLVGILPGVLIALVGTTLAVATILAFPSIGSGGRLGATMLTMTLVYGLFLRFAPWGRAIRKDLLQLRANVGGSKSSA